MKIGMDIRPMIGQGAGIGYYLYRMQLALDRVDPDNEYLLYTDRDFELHLANPRFRKKVIKAPPYLWHPLAAISIIQEKLDVYHSTTSQIIPTLVGGRTITNYQDASAILFSETHTFKVKTLARFLYRLAAHRTGRIITPSEATKKDVIMLTNVRSDKIAIVPEAVDESYVPAPAEKIVRVREKYGLPEAYILYNATLEPRKNISRFIQAFCQIKERYRCEHKLVMAGKKGWLYEEVFALVKKLGLEGEVIFTDWVPDADLPAIYSGASVLLYPSLFEGFGLSILKGFACGVPVVTSNVSSMPEVAGDAAMLVDPYNVDDIAESIWQVVSNPPLAEELREKGFQQLKKYSWEITARKTLDIYNSIRK